MLSGNVVAGSVASCRSTTFPSRLQHLVAAVIFIIIIIISRIYYLSKCLHLMKVSGGWRHTVALDEDGELYGWGWNKVNSDRWDTSTSSVFLRIIIFWLAMELTLIGLMVDACAIDFLTELRFPDQSLLILVPVQFGQVGCGNTDDHNSPKLITGIVNEVGNSCMEFS